MLWSGAEENKRTRILVDNSGTNNYNYPRYFLMMINDVVSLGLTLFQFRNRMHTHQKQNTYPKSGHRDLHSITS